eukprot:scaffold266597_cov24-Tisochrysis_lutea.AAC.3
MVRGIHGSILRCSWRCHSASPPSSIALTHSPSISIPLAPSTCECNPWQCRVTPPGPSSLLAATGTTSTKKLGSFSRGDVAGTLSKGSPASSASYRFRRGLSSTAARASDVVSSGCHKSTISTIRSEDVRFHTCAR